MTEGNVPQATPAPEEKTEKADKIIVIQQPPPKGRPFYKSILVYIIAGLVMFSLIMNVVLLQWFWVFAGRGGGPSEKYVEGSLKSKHKVAIVQIKGLIADIPGGMLSEAGNLKSVIAQLKRAREDKKVVSVILEINSPGGTIHASDVILNEVKKLKAADKRVVVYMEQVAASGGYYVACEADRIYASHTTLTGSIGVIFGTYDMQELGKKIGVKPVIITRGKYKDMGSAWRDMTDDEKARLDVLINGAYDRFKKVIKDGRGLTDKQVADAANGAVLTADEALALKLIDKIGYLEDAIEDAKAGREDIAVVRYQESRGLLSSFLRAESKPFSGDVHVHLDTPIPQLMPGLYYLWLPGWSGRE